MREIGGYFELERFYGEAYHKDAIALNCGRGCIRYLVELRDIKKIWIPDFMCDSVPNAFIKAGAKIMTYKIKSDFLPDYDFDIKDDEWLFICDYYGQLKDEDIRHAKEVSYGRIICDETQGFYRSPIKGVDTIYSCRKWFGVADGGYLISGDGSKLERGMPIDESHTRMPFVLGRYERSATEFYKKSKENNDYFDDEPAKQMSPITENLLRVIDYNNVAKRRRDNWDYLESRIGDQNLLQLQKPDVPFMYPFMVSDAGDIRESLANKGVYIPILWPSVLKDKKSFQISYNYAKNILPLPIDQRYEDVEMGYILGLLQSFGYRIKEIKFETKR